MSRNKAFSKQISNKQFGGSMEIKIGIASLAKSGAEYCGDSYSLVERLGGMTLILSDGHGNTAAAQQTSRWVTQRARTLVLQGKDNDAVARAVLKSVTEGISYETLMPPCGRRQFFECRLWFFVFLDDVLRR